MKIRINIILLLFVMSMLAVPVLAANESENYDLLQPGMGREWISMQDEETQYTIFYLVSMLVVAFAIFFIYYLLRGGANAMGESTEMGDPQKGSKAKTGILAVLVIVVVVVILYNIGMQYFKYY